MTSAKGYMSLVTDWMKPTSSSHGTSKLF